MHSLFSLFNSFSCFIECSLFFFFNDTATTEIYTLSLHDALPIFRRVWAPRSAPCWSAARISSKRQGWCGKCSDRKSTRLNSSHVRISYAVFCLKKKNDRQLRFILDHAAYPVF